MQQSLEQVSVILKAEQIAKQWGPWIGSEQQVVMRRIIVSVERQPKVGRPAVPYRNPLPDFLPKRNMAPTQDAMVVRHLPRPVNATPIC
jgi:hypothetical protein